MAERGVESPPPQGGWRSGLIWRSLSLVWLLYLVFPVTSLLDSHVATSMVVLELSLCGLFTALYVAAVAGPGMLAMAPRVGWAATAALAALVTALCLLPGSNWLGLFIFVAAVAGSRRPVGHAAAAVAATVALTMLLLVWRVGSSPFGPGWAGVAILNVEVAGIGLLLMSVTQLVFVNAELRRARDRAARLAVSEERLRFARDLHDLLGHNLAVIVLKSELMARLAESDPARAAQEAREVEAIARTALRDVREAVAGYRHPRLESELQGLRVALESAGAQVAVDNRAPALPDDVQGALAWAAREAATNILRHSQATEVAVRVAPSEGGGVCLEVVDNGPHRPTPQGAPAAGSGLLGLSERARLLGGSVEAGQTGDGGYRLAVTLPARRGGALGRGTRTGAATP
jgi:two-component system, NarL family, sensor histidine kinase DesK